MSARPLPPPPGLAPRVALVRARYDPAGGAERFVQNAIAALKSQGVALTIVARHWPGHDGSAVLVDPFHVGGLWRDWAFARTACAELARRRFDLVQSHERIPCCDVYRAGDGVHAEWLAQRARAQGVFARLASRASPRHLYMLAAERALFRSPRLKAVICNSEMVSREIEAHFGMPADKRVLIRNAVDCEQFHPGLRAEMRAAVRQQMGIPQDATVLLHVGSGFERKGVAVLLETAARAKTRPHVIVVGRDKHMARYVSAAGRLGIAERTRFIGAVSDVRPYYGAADVFVLATLYDPQPNAALEAMACGLPIVTTTKCGVAELLVEGESGHLRDALDVAGLAEAVERLEGGVGLRVGAAARAEAERHPPAAMARRYLDLYRRLLRR